MRRLLVYLLVDTSGSMRGEPIEAVKVGLEAEVLAIREDPDALELVYISIITFDKEARLLMPLTDLQTFVMPAIATADSGPTHLGQALELLCQRVDAEVVKSTPERKGDWRPLLFIMTAGRLSDLMKYRQMIPEVKKGKFHRIIGCVPGRKAQQSLLEELVTNMVSLDNMAGAPFLRFFLSRVFHDDYLGRRKDEKWITIHDSSIETSTPDDLRPPPEIVIV